MQHSELLSLTYTVKKLHIKKFKILNIYSLDISESENSAKHYNFYVGNHMHLCALKSDILG